MVASDDLRVPKRALVEQNAVQSTCSDCKPVEFSLWPSAELCDNRPSPLTSAALHSSNR